MSVNEGTSPDRRLLLKQYLRLRDNQQHSRIQTGNALDALSRGVSEMPAGDAEKLISENNKYTREEEHYVDLIKEIIEEHPLAEYLKNVKGASTVNCAPLIAELDPHKAQHVSSFWAFAGYGMKDYWAKLKPEFSLREYASGDGHDITDGLPVSWVDAASEAGHEVWFVDDITKEVLTDIMDFGDAYDLVVAGKRLPSRLERFGLAINDIIRGLEEAGIKAEKLDLRRDAPLWLWRHLGSVLTAQHLEGRFKIVSPIKGKKFKTVRGKKERYEATAEPEDDWFLVRVRDQQIKGWLSPFNKELRVMCYRVCSQFIRMGSNSPYERYYRTQREGYAARGWNKGRVHKASVRKTMKLFLQHMWVTWREIEGLPISKPYVIERMGHTTYYDRRDFGWVTD